MSTGVPVSARILPFDGTRAKLGVESGPTAWETNMMRSLLSMGEPRRGHARACGLIALGVGIVLVRGVSAQRISTEYDHAVDFSAFKTFAIVSSTLRSPNPALNSELMKKRIDESFSRAFTGRGLTR